MFQLLKTVFLLAESCHSLMAVQQQINIYSSSQPRTSLSITFSLLHLKERWNVDVWHAAYFSSFFPTARARLREKQKKLKRCRPENSKVTLIRNFRPSEERRCDARWRCSFAENISPRGWTEVRARRRELPLPPGWPPQNPRRPQTRTVHGAAAPGGRWRAAQAQTGGRPARREGPGHLVCMWGGKQKKVADGEHYSTSSSMNRTVWHVTCTLSHLIGWNRRRRAWGRRAPPCWGTWRCRWSPWPSWSDWGVPVRPRSGSDLQVVGVRGQGSEVAQPISIMSTVRSLATPTLEADLTRLHRALIRFNLIFGRNKRTYDRSLSFGSRHLNRCELRDDSQLLASR